MDISICVLSNHRIEVRNLRVNGQNKVRRREIVLKLHRDDNEKSYYMAPAPQPITLHYSWTVTAYINNEIMLHIDSHVP